MLGLMSAVSRRERTATAQLLDSKIATNLRSFSLTHQRQETYKALQLQTQALPAVVNQLQTMMTQMDRMSQQLNERLVSNQESFHGHIQGVYTGLASSVDKSLRESLLQSAHAAGESIKPLVEAAMTGIVHEANLAHERMAGTTQAQLDALTSRLSATATNAAQTVMGTLTATAQAITEQMQTSARDTLGEISRAMASSEELMRTRIESEVSWTRQHGERMDQVAKLLRTEFGALREAETLRGHAAVERLGELQTALTSHLTTLGTALEDPITRLIHTAAEAPRAAAEVIGQLRNEVSNSVARDNALLEERSRIMETLSSLLDTINHASVEQCSAIDSLVASSASTLSHAGSQFSSQVDAEAARLTDIAAHVTQRMEFAIDKDGKKKLSKVAIEITLPPGFPEKYRNAIIKTAGLCSVKKVIMDPPEFEITAI
jgi:hypothetical protein